jgi:hypothetical protein
VRGTPVAPGSRKLLIPLDARDVWRAPAPLGAIYVLAPRPRDCGDRRAVAIRRLSKRQAWTALLRNTFNTAVTEPARLAAQFAWAANVAGIVPVRRLSYKKQLGLLPRVRHAVLEDLLRHRTCSS